MKAYGAELVLSEGDKGMKGAIAKADELAKEIPNSFIPGQFVNPANPQAHIETTGPEIWEEVRQKIMGMYTDPNHLKVSDPGQVEGNSVFTYLDAFCTDEHFEKYLPDYKNLDELKDHYRRGGLGDVKVKKFLNAVMQEELAPIRARRKELERKIPEIYEILHKGSIEAEKVAAQTLKEVKDAMKINYFEDQQLIQEQTARFAE